MSDPHSFKRKKHRRGKRGGRKNRVNRRVPPGLVVLVHDTVRSAAPVSPAVILSLRKRLAQFATQSQQRSA